jgi:hypothetical protein
VIGDLNKYTQFQAAESMRAAAENPGEGGGAASAGIGAGIGMAMGHAMGNAMGGSMQGDGQSRGMTPPPLPPRQQWHVAIDGAAGGPFDQGTVEGMARDGRLTPETLVWFRRCPEFSVQPRRPCRWRGDGDRRPGPPAAFLLRSDLTRA